MKYFTILYKGESTMKNSTKEVKYFTILFLCTILVLLATIDSFLVAQNNQMSGFQNYSDSVQVVWVARYDGQGNGDWANDITIDNSGNVYVTGTSFGSVTGRDYATVKYNALGLEEWAILYNGPGNSADNSNAIGLDNSGNVYVTGQSVGSGTNSDYATIKYNTSGVQEWIARYTSPGSNSDIARAMVVDDSGNVYVAGWSETDYVTIKYNTSGVQQWVAQYNGTRNAGDFVNDIVVDDSGNVYVTGQSEGIFGNGFFTNDYATVKYNALGVQQWVARYNSPENGAEFGSGLAVDALGNVYVTGYSIVSFTNAKYATVKYNASGTEEWVAIYDGLVPGGANYFDYGYSITVDDSGNVYVIGASSDSSGGDIYDFATVKYNSSGTEVWVARYNGPADLIDSGNRIAVDDSGNVYVSGMSDGTGGPVSNSNYTTIKYNSSGIEEWVTSYNGPADAQDVAFNMTIDDSANVYVTGWSKGVGTDYDFATIKYSQLRIVPVELTSFYANVNNNEVVLNWTTATETNNQGFEIEKNSGNEFEKVGYVTGFGTTTEPKVYLFTDDNVETGTYKYRLKQIDFDGTFEYSNTVEVEVPVPNQFTLEQNYPNPFNPTTTIKFSLPVDSKVNLKVFNTLGQEVVELLNGNISKGIKRVSFNASKLSSGVYLYRIVVKGVDGTNFSSVKKMILIE